VFWVFSVAEFSIIANSKAREVCSRTHRCVTTKALGEGGRCPTLPEKVG
jgi:hypothetical protein